MPSGATETPESSGSALALLQPRLAELGFPRSNGKEEEEEEEDEDEDDDGGEAELREDEGGEGSLLLRSPSFAEDCRAVMAAMFPSAPEATSARIGGRSVNSTECVAVPSSEHVAEIVGRQGEQWE